MQKELLGQIAEFSDQLQISQTKRGQAGQTVTAVSSQAASTGSPAQDGGQGLTTLPGSAVSGNVGDISDKCKCLPKQQECIKEKILEKIVQKKVVTKDSGKHDAGNLAHCVSLMETDQSRLNTKLEWMKSEIKHEIKTQMKTIKQKNFQNQKQIFFY